MLSASWATPANASLACASANLAFWLAVVSLFDRWRIRVTV